ncbi:MAG: GGDEF domain-containing protein [Deltaproteobacteria bacterium]|nr:GGDEF domain-containing protein [Deltaproteobacteria bacterium]
MGLFRNGEEAQAFFPDFIGVLLLFLKKLSLDTNDLNTEQFRLAVGALNRTVKTGKNVKEVRALFEKKKKMMQVFIKKQNLYLADKETEYRDVIDLLTRAMAKVSVENDDFSEKMLEQSSRIEHVTSLSDIKEIKDTLKKAIEEIRAKVREKQAKDSQQMAHLSQKVKRLSGELENAEKGFLRDGLTGIYNMKAFERFLRKGVDRNFIEHAPFVMAALDIDEFDKIVENYGDKLGDRVVLAIAEKCREFLKSGDFAARYGGGLFVMILSGETLRKVAKRGKRFCRSVQKSKYALGDMRSEHVFSFTVSMGLTPFRKGDTAEAIIRRALTALKTAKRDGGNRIVSGKGD